MRGGARLVVVVDGDKLRSYATPAIVIITITIATVKAALIPPFWSFWDIETEIPESYEDSHEILPL